MRAHFFPILLACGAALALHAEPGSAPPVVPLVEAPVEKPPEDPRDAAKREAWTSAVLIVSLLEQGDNQTFPGIRVWLEDFRRTAGNATPPEPGKPFPPLDADALVTRNPNFWTAFFEVQPGDPGFALLHAALLLAGGEAQRASALATFGLQRPSTSEEVKRGLTSLIAHCLSAQAHSNKLVGEGIERHDRRDFAGALKSYEAALAAWPANAWAHYERGSTLRMKAIAEARRKPGEGTAETVSDPPETVACFARARQHHPLHLLAYQGDDPAMRDALMALVRSGLPAWEAIRKHPDHPVKTPQLRDFSEACQTAAIDDFALVLRQLVVASNKGCSPDDRDFFLVSLQRLVPAALTPALLARIGAEPRFPVRQIVVPVTVDPPDLALASADETPPKEVKKKEPADKPKAKGKSAKMETSEPTKKKAKRKVEDSDDPPAKPKPKAKKRTS